jgi:hypothetical protein
MIGKGTLSVSDVACFSERWFSCILYTLTILGLIIRSCQGTILISCCGYDGSVPNVSLHWWRLLSAPPNFSRVEIWGKHYDPWISCLPFATWRDTEVEAITFLKFPCWGMTSIIGVGISTPKQASVCGQKWHPVGCKESQRSWESLPTLWLSFLLSNKVGLIREILRVQNPRWTRQGSNWHMVEPMRGSATKDVPLDRLKERERLTRRIRRGLMLIFKDITS